MTRTRVTLAAAFIAFALTAALAAGCASASSGAATVAPTDGAGLVSALCTKCHPLQRVQAAKKNRDGWTRTVTRMQTHGLQVTDTQKQAILDYLTRRDGGS